MTASTGNHALGVAFAADRLGVPATVVVPENASPAKLAALGRYQARVVTFGDSYDAAEQHALDLASGLGLAATRSGRMTVIGVESDASLAVSTAIRAGRVTPVDVGPTLADGLAGNLEPGSITPGLIRVHLRSLVSVTDEQIADAIRFLVREHGLVAEGAGAAPVAAGRVAPGGLLCVRVNATDTDVEHAHRRLDEQAGDGSFTVRYQAGPQAGLDIHFFTAAELRAVVGAGFSEVLAARLHRTERTPPSRGHWAQWEAIWRRHPAAGQPVT